VGEWEIEAAIEGTFRQLGAAGPAFPTIVGSGANGIVLHYTANDRVVGEGDLVLVDAGARWGGYCSDITRTFPASGRFTAPQREIYDIVLAAERAGIAAAAPGAPVSAIHDAAVGELARGLLRLRLVEGADAQEVIAEGRFRRFYMHQTAHWLGLEVHDSGGYRDDGEPIMLQPGMVLTVEPGLYIPAADDIQERYRGIGIRIEDDVLITGTGNEVLTRELPTDAEAVETMSRSRMASKLSQ
jgi:Xaa-Pro aminopeptidase